MRAPPNWTTPGEVEARLNRIWIRGRFCAERLGLRTDGPPLFPISLRLTRPDARALGEQFDDVRRWIRTIEEGGSSGSESWCAAIHSSNAAQSRKALIRLGWGTTSATARGVYHLV
jgi:hypothetical protein